MTRVGRIELLLVGLPLARPFRTSFGIATRKECVVIRVETDGAEGWGECVADVEPDFSAEWNGSVWSAIEGFLGPALLHEQDVTAGSLSDVFGSVRGNPMAKATLVNALLDAELRERDESLASYLGADKKEVVCGVSVGITETVDELRAQVDGYLAEGYRRIKLKIAPGLDLDRVAPIRAHHPDILLSVDANAAYTLEDLDVFRALDAFDLLMIEQPLHHEDLVQHAKLQAQIRTDLCLDESIRSAADAAAALEVGACRIVNIKQGRVGGVLEARAVHDVCLGAGVPVWCGGMLETGIGRATNLALAAMPGFTLPNDTSASARYFPEDLTEPFVLESDGTMWVPDGPGIGVVPLPDRLEACTLRREVLEA
ncbi:MAG: o-succinylbenzoate synthase [Actinobacteria bacterium]|nr:MAG: o-succinylbenzoate synthase [Actinomycetota bacterium]